MKISKLYIEEYKQLKDLLFDFTYPDDFHDETKRGKPLEKICFIGQSGTGKTNLLEIIYQKRLKTHNIIFDPENSKFDYKKTDDLKDLNCEAFFISNNDTLSISISKFRLNQNELIIGKVSLVEKLFNYLKDKGKLIYLKANLISENNLKIFNQHPLDLDEKYKDKFPHFVFLKEEIISVYDDTVDNLKWLSLLQEYISYNKRFTQIMSELTHKISQTGVDKFEEVFKNWKKENPRNLQDFASFFNPILQKLNLEVDLINTEFPVPIKDKNSDKIIPIYDTSTGTKGLLLSFLPLFNTNTKDSIILIDEPERSLFPDIQMELMDYYQNAAPDAQFVIATHSPFIAASFEPEERFILYFDEEGKVAVRRGSSPIGDDPNDMLKNDFGVNYYNKFGEEAYKKYLKLKEDIANEQDPDKKKKILLETVKLGNTYNF